MRLPHCLSAYILFIVLTAVIPGAAHAEETVPWGGAGWYQVRQTRQGPRLIGGPYKTELACKKAMNVNEPGRSCAELSAPPDAPRQ